MKFLLQNKIYRNISEIAFTTLIIVAILVSSLTPRVVDAYGKMDAIMQIPEFFIKPAQAQVPNSFPNIVDIQPRNTVWTTITAYSSEVAQTDASPCIPADGSYNLCEHYEQNGEQDTIAANFLPLGTKVRFPDLYGDKVFTVRDRMNARYGHGRADIWLPSKPEAVQFGVKRVKMEVFYR